MLAALRPAGDWAGQGWQYDPDYTLPGTPFVPGGMDRTMRLFEV
jgi:hypothetical protein